MCTATPYDGSDVFFRVDASVDSKLNGFGYEKLTSRVMKIPYKCKVGLYEQNKTIAKRLKYLLRIAV
jgi:hypothetical protein